MAEPSDAARFLLAVADADSDGITAKDVAAYLETQLDPGDLLRLRVGCIALISAIDRLTRTRRAARQPAHLP